MRSRCMEVRCGCAAVGGKPTAETPPFANATCQSGSVPIVCGKGSKERCAPHDSVLDPKPAFWSGLVWSVLFVVCMVWPTLA
jgi:hypothetical protein